MVAETAESSISPAWMVWGRGVVFAMVGSAIGVISWVLASTFLGRVRVIEGYTDLFAITIGLFAAAGVVYGTGELRGYPSQAIALLATMLALVIGQVIVVRVEVVRQLEAEGFTDFEFVASILDYLRWGLGTSLPALLAWVIAATYAIAVPRKRPEYQS